MSKEHKITLKARHFRGAVFGNNADCALARAIREEWGVHWRMAITHAYALKPWDLRRFVLSPVHEDIGQYRPERYKEDKAKAELASFDDTPIREIVFADQ